MPQRGLLRHLPGLAAYLQHKVNLCKDNATLLEYVRKDFGVRCSPSTLKRFLRRSGIRRRHQTYRSIVGIMRILRREITGMDVMKGYRRMFRTLKKKGYRVRQDDVRIAMGRLGILQPPIGRPRFQRAVYKSAGSDQCWHIDGHDKLAIFGIYIHGGIDGFSRKVLWLEAETTNKDPKVVCKYFLDYILERNGLPRVTRVDPGTENVDIEICQRFLRRNHQDSIARNGKVHWICKSQFNQRIEALWRFVKWNGILHYIRKFKRMERRREWSRDNLIDRLTLLFVYLPVIKEELKKWKDDWNEHRIRHQRNAECPSGIVEDNYNFPERVGGQTKTCPVVPGEIAFLRQHRRIPQRLQDLSSTFSRLAKEELQRSRLTINAGNADIIYRHLQAYFDRR